MHIRKTSVIVTVSVWFNSKSFLNYIHWKLKNEKHNEVKYRVRNNAVSFLYYCCNVNFFSVDVVVIKRLLYTDKQFEIQHPLIWCQNLAKKKIKYNLHTLYLQISSDLRRRGWQVAWHEIAKIKFIIFVNITTVQLEKMHYAIIPDKPLQMYRRNGLYIHINLIRILFISWLCSVYILFFRVYVLFCWSSRFMRNRKKAHKMNENKKKILSMFIHCTPFAFFIPLSLVHH